MKGEGEDALWGWFGLSYASFCVMPRILMHAMPDEWQGAMSKLLNEYEASFDIGKLPSCKVMAIGDKERFASWPDWMLHYRRPDQRQIDALRLAKPDPAEEKICPICNSDWLYVPNEIKCYGCGLGF